MAGKMIVTKSKLDALANSIAAKSGESLPMTLLQMKEAVDGIVISDFTTSIVIPEQTLTIAQQYTEITNFNELLIEGTEYRYTINNNVMIAEAAVQYGSVILMLNSNVLFECINSKIYFDVMDSSLYGNYTIKVEKVINSSSATLISKSITLNGTYNASDDSADGYSSVTVNVPATIPSLQSKTATPSETAQTITADSGYDGLLSVEVGAISNAYVGSGVARKTSTDLTVSGATVTVPSGYYANQATKSVASGTEGTPTATKGTVSNHQVSVTPSVTNTAGYISGGTKTGTAVTVTAAELASGNKEITENGTNIDVVGYSTVSVDVSGSSYTSWQTLYDGTTSITASSPNYIVIPNYTIPLQADETYRITWGETTYIFQTKVDSRGVSYDGYFVGNRVVIGGTDDGSGIALLLYRDTATRMLGVTTDTGTKYLKIEKQITTSANLQAKTNISPTTSSQIITADVGYDGLSSVQINAMPSGTAGTPTASKGTVSNHSISVTPTVTNVSGYIDGGTITGTAVSVSASELVSGTYSVTSSGTKDVTNYASISVGSGTEGTPTATKGTVSNHSVSITPSVTNSGGYITGSTKTGTAVTVSASELVSGSQTITENGTVNVINLASVNVAIPVVTYYTGTSEPVASQYNDGDIYLKVVNS